jgi:hypothetical protein
MGEDFKITQDMMKNADTYIPLTLKALIADTMARECVRHTYMVKPYGEKPEYKDEYGVPPQYCENAEAKARVMMAVLCVYYLHIWNDEHALTCTPEEYDGWAGAHILNQIERYKAGEYREKAFDLLSDLRETEKYLNSAIYGVLRELNDPVKRFMEALGYLGSAEGVQDALDMIRESADGIEKERERQEEIIHGDLEDTEAGEQDAAGD